MSDEQKVEQPTEEPRVSVEDFQKVAEQVEQLKGSNERILAESKDWKSKYQNLKSEQEQSHRETLEQNGETEKLLEIEKNRVHELQLKLQEKEKKALKKDLDFEVAKYANDAQDVDLVIKSLTPDMVSYDEEQGKVVGVQDAVSKLREEKPFLFKKAAASGMVDGRPSRPVDKETPLSEMSKEQHNEILGNALQEFFK